ncbi:MAG: hypothetical protein GX811_11245 [Lentisphaerae bacterium]|nr:hypothetical protein [Lentisphaerota bacterium]
MKQFESLRATELYCPKCKSLKRVNEKLLLIIPGGEIKAYTCERCGETLGTHQENYIQQGNIVIPG